MSNDNGVRIKDMIRNYEDAGIIRRLCAYLLDVVFVIVPPLLIGYLFYSSNHIVMNVLKMMAIPIGFIFYQTLCVYKIGKTVGGLIMGIKVISVDKINVPLYKALIRGLFLGIASVPMRIISAGNIALAICFLSVFFPPDAEIRKKRQVFDILSGTCVIREP